MVRDGAGARLLNGEGVGWLGNARPASDVEHAGGDPPRLSRVLIGAGMCPRTGGYVARAKRSTAGGRAIGTDRSAWAMPGHRTTWPGTCPRVGRVIWREARAVGTGMRHSRVYGGWGCAVALGGLRVAWPASGSLGGVPEGLGMPSCMPAACGGRGDMRQVGYRG